MTANYRQCSYVHRGGETPLLGSTIWSFFEHTVKTCPQAEALVSIPQDRRFTYAGFHQEATKPAKGLMALNVGRGDRIGIRSTNNLEWVFLQTAKALIMGTRSKGRRAWIP
ncbi:AMP-binding protein [Candidatus Nitrospira neomarina]|uniref:AMP-binding protein n=1 Tax=Candidatus Nitrospira neomarina TaxID=3020899 RepID=A0AA96K222_9BACT|nr:AMP-binding protein [Candidatus Nitrospira neomarina]WNM63661.1 AMP-binding protein [Candidatus Nitrospira neomarina]